MGFRTVVMLNNDQCSSWSDDPELGKKIMIGMNSAHELGFDSLANLDYGRVVQCAHADTATLALLNHYTAFTSLGNSYWRSGVTSQDQALEALRDAAEKLGYRLVKKSVTA